MMVHAFSFISYKHSPQSPELDHTQSPILFSLDLLILLGQIRFLSTNTNALRLGHSLLLGSNSFLSFRLYRQLARSLRLYQLTLAPLLPPLPTTSALSPSSTISTSPSSSSNSDPDSESDSSSSEESCVFLDLFLGFLEVALVLLMGDVRSVTLFYSSAPLK
jgi:hypothetical protein